MKWKIKLTKQRESYYHGTWNIYLTKNNMNVPTDPHTFIVHTVDTSSAAILSGRFIGHLRQLVTNWLSQEQSRTFQMEIDRLEQQVAPYASWAAQLAQVSRAAAIARSMDMNNSDRFALYWPAWILWSKNMRWLRDHLETKVATIPFVEYDEIIRLYKWLRYRIEKAILRSQKPKPQSPDLGVTTLSNDAYTKLCSYRVELEKILADAGNYDKSARKHVRERVATLGTMAQQIPDTSAWEVAVLKTAITQLVRECISTFQRKAPQVSNWAWDTLSNDAHAVQKSWVVIRTEALPSIEISEYDQVVIDYLDLLLNEIRNVIADKGSVWDWRFRQDAVSPFLRNLSDKIRLWVINPEAFSWREITSNMEVQSNYGKAMKRALVEWSKQKQWFLANLDIFVWAMSIASERLNIAPKALQGKINDFLSQKPPPTR